MFASLGGKKKEQTFVVRYIIFLGNLNTVAKMTASRLPSIVITIARFLRSRV